MIRLWAFVALSAALVAQQVPPASLEIDVNKPVAKVSPILYGLMTEEINYSYDGGLYAETVRNRTFNDSNWDLPAWSLVLRGDSIAHMDLDKSTGPSTALPKSLKVTIDKADNQSMAGLQNAGFWGFPVRPNTIYPGSFYAKAENPIGPVTIALMDDNTGAALASATVESIGTGWQRYAFTLKTGDVETTSAAHLMMLLQQPGTFWIDLLSLFPPTYHDRPNGDRIDLMEKLAAMKPAFLRFPGGNYLEGDRISERFEWKKSIGPLVDRPTHPSPWHYHSSDGMGLLEFLEWCEDLHMQPVLAVYAGYSLMGEHVDPGPALQPYVQDALDEIEYVTGDTGTKWGAIRAKDGHPAPFSLKFVEIGNEDQFDKSGSYGGRYKQFYEAIKQKYPNLQLIATAPITTMKPDVIDDHYYRRPEEFFDDTHHYDKTDRNGPKIFVGEWATREGEPTPNMSATLADAAWMTGLERNSDIVIMASYAPLFVNVDPGGLQWQTDLIGYNRLNSYGSPSYYAQVMFSNQIGDEVLESKLDGGGPRLFYSITRKEDTLFLKLVNADSAPQSINLKLNGAGGIQDVAKLITLRGTTPNETNSIAEPNKIIPVDSTITNVAAAFEHSVPPYAIEVIEIRLK